MVSTRFPLGGSVGFLMDAERRTLPGAAARSHVKLATGPLELAKRCGSQPALRHLTAVCIIRPTAQPTTRSHTSLHPGSHQPPVTAVSGATRKMPSHVQHGFTPPPPNPPQIPIPDPCFFHFGSSRQTLRQTQPESREM